MRELALGNTRRNSNFPTRGDRVADYVEAYLASHKGLSLGELAFRLRADKRDLQRLVRDRSCGWRLEDALAAYFGPDFVDAVFAPVMGDGPSIRQRELDIERAEIAARAERLERDRAERRKAWARSGPAVRLVDDQGRRAAVSSRGRPGDLGERPKGDG